MAAVTSCHHPMPPSLLHHELSEHGEMPPCPQHAPCLVPTYGGLHIRASCILQAHSCRSCAQHHPPLSLCNITSAAVPSQAMPTHGCDISVSTPCVCCVQEAAGQSETRAQVGHGVLRVRGPQLCSSPARLQQGMQKCSISSLRNALSLFIWAPSRGEDLSLNIQRRRALTISSPTLFLSVPPKQTDKGPVPQLAVLLPVCSEIRAQHHPWGAAPSPVLCITPAAAHPACSGQMWFKCGLGDGEAGREGLFWR